MMDIKNYSPYLIRPICTVGDYKAALALVAPYFDNEPEMGSGPAAYFEVMLTSIEVYEARQYPISPPQQPASLE